MNEGVFFLDNELALLNSMLNGDCEFQKYCEGGDYYELWNSLLGVRDGESFIFKLSFRRADDKSFDNDVSTNRPESTSIVIQITDSGPRLPEVREIAASISSGNWRVSEVDSIDSDFVDIVDSGGERVARVYSTGRDPNPIINASNIVNAQNNISTLMERAEYYKKKLYNDLDIIKEKLEEASGTKIEIVKNEQLNRADF